MVLNVGVNGASCTLVPLQVRAIYVTSSNVTDAALVPQLLVAEPLLTVTGDGPMTLSRYTQQ